MDLPLLSKDYSWQVFHQCFGNGLKDLGSEFQEVGKEIVNKCGGMPLAIKVISGVLRNKKRAEQWHAIRDNNLLDVDDKARQVSACLWLSYFNLPYHLKQCFTICAIFPKGHLIDKDQLIDKWIAHNMVVEDGINYLEYVGDDYFSHLVQMYFIQDVKGEGDGRVKCKMHDLVHDLARSILGDEISLVMPKKETNGTKICRYFCIMEQTRHLSPKSTFQKARALYIAEYDDFIFGKALKNARHLCSITVKYVYKSALTAILQTKNLRYLKISGLRHETLPEVISEIWSLQALYMMSSHLVKLPESIGNLKKLRVVNLSYSLRLTSLPDSIGNCVMISSIDLEGCTKFATLPSSISRNRSLRVLRLGQTMIERLPSSITALENLESLDLQHCLELVELPEGIGNLKKLVVLNLQGCQNLQAIPKGIAQLTQLEMLGLFVMGEDGEKYAKISELENVNKISGELTIRGIAHGIDPDVEHKEWLPHFRLLSKLELSDFPKLEHLEGLTELPCLEKLVLKNMTALRSISGGPFPSLYKLSMNGMPSLGAVWMVTDGILADLEGGQLQIGNHLSVVTIKECPKLMVMPYFPLSLKDLRLARSNVQLLGQPGLGQGSSLPSFSFSCLKELLLDDMTPPTFAAPYGSGCGWELLQHLTALESLYIESSDGLTELPESMRSLASLRYLYISRCSALCMPPEWLGELRYLERMDFNMCGSLSPAPSMQPLKALKALALKTLHISHSGWVGDLCSPSLQTLWIQYCDNISSLPQSFSQLTTLTTLIIIKCADFLRLPECLGKLRSLQMLHISELPKLSSLPESLGCLTSLQDLRIGSCEALGQLPESVGKLHSLRVFSICWLPSLTCLPQSLGYLTSLQKLHIGNCEALAQLPKSIGELRSLHGFHISDLRSLTCLPQSLGRLTSLQELEIKNCEALGQLPESLGELRSLRKFEIWGLRILTSVPKSMCCLTSLEQLTIGNCTCIKSLPKWIKGLTALQTLRIYGCPDLERLCEIRKGKDWHLISHIPHLLIGEEV